MENSKEFQMSGPEVRRLRESLGMGQREFWGAINVSRVTGHNYEAGKYTKGIPEMVRRCIYLHHVAGVPFDGTQEDFMMLGEIVRGPRFACRNLRASLSMASEANRLIEQATSRLSAAADQVDAMTIGGES